MQKEKPSKIVEHDKVIPNLVKEEARPKKRLNEILKLGKELKKRKKIISFDDDVDFDAVLDAASAGFVKTERDMLVRKETLTPFHRLKGFERHLQQPGPSNRDNLPEDKESSIHIRTEPIVRQILGFSWPSADEFSS